MSDQAPGGIVQGTVRITRTSADAGSGVASSVLQVGPVGACTTGTTVRASWNTTAYTDGSYDVCNTVTDRAGYSTTAVVTVTVANAVPIPAPVAPVPVASTSAAPPATRAARGDAGCSARRPERAGGPDEAGRHPAAFEARHRPDPADAALGEPGVL